MLAVWETSEDIAALDAEAFDRKRRADHVDLIFNGGKVTKAAWVLSEEDQTAETGTLADFLESLGATVQEIDLDAGDDEDDDAERDGDGFVEDEAEEEEGDDEKAA